MEGQEALAGAPVRRAHRQPAKVLRRLAPAGMINRQHDGTAYLPAAGCNAPVYPNPHQKPWASNWTRFRAPNRTSLLVAKTRAGRSCEPVLLGGLRRSKPHRRWGALSGGSWAGHALPSDGTLATKRTWRGGG